MRIDFDTAFTPGAVFEDDAMKGLGVEKFVGKDDERTFEVKCIADSDRLSFEKRICDTVEKRGIGFWSDLNPPGLVGMNAGFL